MHERAETLQKRTSYSVKLRPKTVRIESTVVMLYIKSPDIFPQYNLWM